MRTSILFAASIALLACGASDTAGETPPPATEASGGSNVGGSSGAGGTTGGSGGSHASGSGGSAGHAGSGHAGQPQGGSAGQAQGGSAGQPVGGQGGQSQGGTAQGGQSQGGSAGEAQAGSSQGGSAQGGSAGQAQGGQAGSPPMGLTVSGNQLLRDGKPFQLHGANHSGTEYACIQGWGLGEGPTDSTLTDPMKAWNVNAVRIPLNEDCWLAINGVMAQYAGADYQKHVHDLVTQIHSAGMVVVLDLHWNAPGSNGATGQQNMADADHAPDFWKSVATSFADDPEVLFDLYNEPHDVSWSCWRDGCSDPGFQTAGMQSLVDAVRSTGAKQPLMLGGLAWSNDLSQWLDYMPSDPENALVASHHDYNFNACTDQSCWDGTLGKVAAMVPVVTGELGENDCMASYVDSFMVWADANGIGYLGWTWNTWDCQSGPALIQGYDGTPTAFGMGYRDHIQTLP